MIYVNNVDWRGGVFGHTVCQNGTAMDYSAPPVQHGASGVMTPEDAFIMAVNTGFQVSAVRELLKAGLDVAAYECRVEGEENGSAFTHIRVMPKVTVCGAGTEAKAKAALELAINSSPIISSIKSEIVLEPEIVTIGY